MSGAVDHSEVLGDFCAMTGASPEQATQYLEANSFSLTAAVNSYFQDEDEANAERREREAESIPADYTGPRTLDGRPVPDAGGSSSRGATRKSGTQQKKKGIATLGSLGGSSHHHDDDDDDDDDDEDEDDEGRGNLFAGGEKSGLAVQDPNPKPEGGPRKIINDILAKARANARNPEADSEAGPSRDSRFRGTGQTVGGDGIESESIPDPLGAARPSGQPQERVLHIWQDGFSIDDGELRRFDDPANQADLQMIRSGRAPLHLMNVQHDQPVDVKLHQHDTPYTPQPKQYKPFGGEGRRLGSPVPGAGNEGSLNAAVSSTATTSTGSSNTAAPTVDSSQPTIMIRIQLPDGTRLPARFNTTHTLDDVYGFVQSSSPDTRTRSWVLATTFPNKEHTDRSLVLSEIPEFKKGGTAVVKWT